MGDHDDCMEIYVQCPVCSVISKTVSRKMDREYKLCDLFFSKSFVLIFIALINI